MVLIIKTSDLKKKKLNLLQSLWSNGETVCIPTHAGVPQWHCFHGIFILQFLFGLGRYEVQGNHPLNIWQSVSFEFLGLQAPDLLARVFDCINVMQYEKPCMLFL